MTPPCLAVTAALACAPPGEELRAARLEAEGRNLVATLDRLEDRLVENQARVRDWQELRARRERTTESARAARRERPLAVAAPAPPSPPRRSRARVAAVSGEARAERGADSASRSHAVR